MGPLAGRVTNSPSAHQIISAGFTAYKRASDSVNLVVKKNDGTDGVRPDVKSKLFLSTKTDSMTCEASQPDLDILLLGVEHQLQE